MTSTERFEIQLCGGLRVRRGGSEVDLSKTARQGRRALAYLVLNRDRAVSRDELMERLWSDPDPQRVATSLTQTLSRLRRELGADRLERLAGGAVRLRGDPEVDIDRAEARLLDVRRAVAGCAWEAARQAATATLAELAGEVLAGDEADWLEPVRRHVADLRVEAHELLGTAALHLGSPGDAERAARTAIDAGETRESSWALLIEAQAARGDIAEATASFHEFRARLRDVYGLAPSRQLIDRHSLLVQGGTAPVSPPAPAPPLPPRLQHASRAAFVGREAELELLLGAWSSAESDGPRLVLVEGAGGIGKTRLAAQFAERLRRHGATVLYGRCDEDLGAPYQPWIDSLDQLLATASPSLLERHVQTFGPVLARLVPAIAPGMAGARSSQTNDPEAERYLLFGAVANLLCEASAERSVLLVLDDLQWADKPTLLLLRHLIGSSRPMRLLALGMSWSGSDARTDRLTAPADSLTDPADILSDLAREPETERIELEGLTRPDVVALFEAVAGRELTTSKRAFADDLTTKANGNPFFVLQILRQRMGSTTGVGSAESWSLTEPQGVKLPKPVRQAIARRTRRLGRDADQLLRIAAVIGREFDVDVLARVGGRSHAEVLDVLATAVAARLVTEVGGTRFTFSHALLNQALADEFLEGQREQLHLRIAEALESLGGESRLGELAHHRLASRVEPARAVAAAQAAGRWALAQLAPHEAVRWFGVARKRLVDLDPGDGPELVELLISLGEAQKQAGEGTYRDTLLEAAALAHEQRDADRLARAVLANTRGFESASGRVDADRVAALQRAIALLGGGDGRRRARLLAQLQLEQTFVADLAERRALSDEAKALAERSADATTLAHVLWARHAVLWTPDLLDEHRANAADLEGVAAGLNDPVARFWAACDLVLTSVWSADIAEADRGLATMQEVADRVGQPILRWIRLWYGAWRAYLAGDLGEAERLAIAAGDQGGKIGQPDAEVFSMNQRMAVAWDRGRLGDEVARLESLAVEIPGLPVFRGWLALAHCERGELDAAARLLEADAANGFADLPWDIVWLTTVSLFAEAATRLRAHAAVATLAAMLEPYADQIVFNATSVHGSVARFLGGLAAAADDLPAADAHFARAAAMHERLGAHGLLARTRCEWGRALRRSRDPADVARAEMLLEQACTTARELGMDGILSRAGAPAPVAR